jgi:hypothetical protein
MSATSRPGVNCAKGTVPGFSATPTTCWPAAGAGTPLVIMPFTNPVPAGKSAVAVSPTTRLSTFARNPVTALPEMFATAPGSHVVYFGVATTVTLVPRNPNVDVTTCSRVC